jgi:cytosine/adenosine deaminase-related metal-dependent hydrolase
MIRYRAAWVLPVSSPPLRDGWIEIDGDRIAALGTGGHDDRSAENLGSVAVLPGLVNAHTHLELSHLRDRVPSASSFVSWAGQVVRARRDQTDPAAPEILSAVADGIAEAVRCGTALVGDISNSLVTVEPLVRSELSAVVFYELIRFNALDPGALVEEAGRRVDLLPAKPSVRVDLAAHAPYSVGLGVFTELRKAMDQRASARCSVHLAESAEEIEFIREGRGPWRAFLEQVGAWDPGWVPPGRSPVQYLDEVGFLDERVLAVHGVQMKVEDLACLAARGTTVVTCPRSNNHTGAGRPPLEAFYASGVRVAVGTDSLASTPDLNVFAELAAMRRLAPAVPASLLLESATRAGAHALGFEADFGAIEPGKRARLLAVSVPASVDDVEEYLVSGVEPDQVRWLVSGTRSVSST